MIPIFDTLLLVLLGPAGLVMKRLVAAGVSAVVVEALMNNVG